ncbi:hypothetical protein JOQ06_001172, partial [Pogonophryne albipinna]
HAHQTPPTQQRCYYCRLLPAIGPNNTCTKYGPLLLRAVCTCGDPGLNLWLCTRVIEPQARKDCDCDHNEWEECLSCFLR